MKKMDKATRSRTHSSPEWLALRKASRRAPHRGGSATLHSSAAHILLSETVEFLLRTGESRESIASELQGLARRVNGRERMSRVEDAQQVHDGNERITEVCGVVHDWHREAAYTNQDGDPLQLTSRSLRTLVSKRFPKQKVSATVAWMLENGVIRKTRSGKIALVGGRVVLFARGGQCAVILGRAAILVPQYLRMALRNANTRDPYSRDIEREARIFYLPEKYVPLWRAVARERARAFLEGVDNWLEDHARRDDVGPVREVAMHCYAYTGDPRAPTAADIRRLKVGT